MSKRAAGVLVILLAVAAGPSSVPAEFQDLVLALEERIDAFDAALATKKPDAPEQIAFGAELLTANGNRDLQLLNPSALPGVRLEMDRVKALSASTVTVSMQFPLLFPSF